MPTSVANLASMYGNQGWWKEAEELEVQVTETRKRAGRGASFHTDLHEQSCVHIERSGSGRGDYHVDERKCAANETCLTSRSPLGVLFARGFESVGMREFKVSILIV